MNNKHLTLLVILLIIGISLIYSCSAFTSENPAPEQIPTNSSISTFNLINYTHPSNCFGLSYPVGWNIEEHESSVTFNSPDNNGTIEVIVVNTGFRLDAEGFMNFVNATEINWFGTYKNYQEINRQTSTEEGYAYLTKTLDWNKIPQNVSSFYQQKGEVVYWVNFWENQVSDSTLQPIFDQISELISYNSAYCEDLAPYQTLMLFVGPKNLFSLQVPIQWTHTIEKADVFQIDTFLAPDLNAAIQNITYDDGKIVTRGAADTIALDFLKEIYAEDVRISSARFQPDNSIRWIWESTSGGCQGITFYETRGTPFLMLTIMYVNDHEEIYLPLLETIISSYSIPE